MNRMILKHGTPLTIVILAVFAWVIVSRIIDGGPQSVVLLAVTAVVIWAVGVAVFIYVWPWLPVSGYKRIITKGGLGGGPVPVNTLYVAQQSPSQSAASGNVIATGTDDVLYVGGWLDVKAGPQVLHVPDMDGRYYSLQFTDPTTGANFAYVGKRTTGTGSGDFLLCAPKWNGDSPDGFARIDVPRRVALLIGRVFVADEDDRPTAYALAKQMRLSPFIG